jgi:hypothetical protein
LAKPLYEVTKGEGWKPMVWGEKTKKRAFKKIKRALTNTSALGLPVVMKPFFMKALVYERQVTAVGVLTQLLGSWHFPVAYLSKQLNTVSQGWPQPCLCALAATAVLVAKADKLTLG